MLEQRTDEWFAARLGKVTASRVADVMAKTKTGYSATRANYHAQLVAERLTGTAADSFSNAAMQWGTDTEPQARAMYSFKHGIDVTETGFHDHPAIAMSGASPDGLAGDTGLVEIKCPNTATHIATLRGGTIDRKYILQMHWQMACTGREWCDFVSFDPRLPLEMQLFVQRVPLDAALLSEIETEVTAFLSEVDEAVADLRTRYSLREAA
jgi:putative phage-type endonuclease